MAKIVLGLYLVYITFLILVLCKCIWSTVYYNFKVLKSYDGHLKLLYKSIPYFRIWRLRFDLYKNFNFCIKNYDPEIIKSIKLSKVRISIIDPLYQGAREHYRHETIILGVHVKFDVPKIQCPGNAYHYIIQGRLEDIEYLCS